MSQSSPVRRIVLLFGSGGVYAEVLNAFPGRKVVVRTLDAGSDSR